MNSYVCFFCFCSSRLKGEQITATFSDGSEVDWTFDGDVLVLRIVVIVVVDEGVDEVVDVVVDEGENLAWNRQLISKDPCKIQVCHLIHMNLTEMVAIGESITAHQTNKKIFGKGVPSTIHVAWKFRHFGTGFDAQCWEKNVTSDVWQIKAVDDLCERAYHCQGVAQYFYIKCIRRPEVYSSF